MWKSVTVSPGGEPWLTNVLVCLITRMGRYLDRSGAQWLIARRLVTIDGIVAESGAISLSPGSYLIGVEGKQRLVNVLAPSLE